MSLAFQSQLLKIADIVCFNIKSYLKRNTERSCMISCYSSVAAIKVIIIVVGFPAPTASKHIEDDIFKNSYFILFGFKKFG